MSTKTSNHELMEAIERVIQEHLDASRVAATAAIQRALGGNAKAKSVRPRAPRSASSRRRTKQEIIALAGQLLEAICADPGQSMATLADRLGTTPRDVGRSVTLLKKAGHLRTTGQRNWTRYYPTTTGTKNPSLG